MSAPLVRTCFLLLLLLPAAAFALDHDNLDPNRPIAIEDAYVVAEGEIGIEGGVVFQDRKQGQSRFVFQPQIIYGAFANTQIEIQSNLLTDPNSAVGTDKSGNLRVAALYNFNTETIALPAFAGRVEVAFPTGVNARGVDAELDGVMTRSFGRLRAHVNVGYTFLGSPQGGERSGIYKLVAAVSYPIGYPMRFRETLIVDVFTRQSDLSGQRNPTGVGVGLRHQASSRIVLDGGIGSELMGPADRSIFFGTVGLSVGF